MSKTNGKVIKIGRKGKMTFAFEGHEGIVIDVIAVQTRWANIDDGFRDSDGMVPKAQQEEHAGSLHAFVQELFAPVGPDDLTLAEVYEFMAKVRAECKELQHFFEPELSEEPSSQESIEIVYGE